MSKIAYLWIEDWSFYGKVDIKKQGFNFDSDYYFSFNDGIISSDKKRNFENIFCINNKSNIDIVGLVGKNGSCKSSIIKLLQNLFAGNELMNSYKFQNNKIKDNILLIIKNDEGKYELYYNSEPKEYDKYLIVYKGEVSETSDTWKEKVFKDTDFIFFSNIFETTDMTNEIYNINLNKHKKIYDISTNFLLQWDSQKLIQDLYSINSNYLFIHNTMENYRKLKFLTNKENKLFLKEILNREIVNNKLILYINPFYDKGKVEFTEAPNPYIKYSYIKARKLFANIDDFIKINFNIPIDSFIYKLLNVLIYATVKVLDYYNSKEKLNDKIFKKFDNDAEIIDYLKLDGDIWNKILNITRSIYGDDVSYLICEEILDIKITWCEGNEFNIVIGFLYELISKIKCKIGYDYKFKNDLEKQLNSIEKIAKLANGLLEDCKKNPRKYLYDNASGIDIFLDNELEDLVELFKEYENIRFIQQIFRFELSGFSSGENALLNILSRLYDLGEGKLDNIKLKNIENHEQNIENELSLKQNIIIFLDEPELYFHPEWQRKLIYILVKFFETNELYKNKNIQIILTSNAPFLISDLPKENLIFLEEKDGKCISENNSKFEQTFGQNIHTLLTRAFFMDTTIGEFAKTKINMVIKFLQEEKYRRKNNSNNLVDEKEKNYHKYIIGLIGEPIIRNKLEKMYFEVFSEDLDIKEQVNLYKNKVIELQNQIINGKIIDENQLKTLREELKKALDTIDDFVKDGDNI